MNPNSMADANANTNIEPTPRIPRHPAAEFHLLSEEAPEQVEASESSTRQDTEAAATPAAMSPQPIVFADGVNCLVHDGTRWTAVSLSADAAFHAVPDEQNIHASPSSKRPDGNARRLETNTAPLFERLSGRGALPRLLMINTAGHRARVNGVPAARITLLSANDRLQFDESPTFRVTIYHRPQMGPVPTELVGARCPVCTIPLTVEDHCLICGCGAALHASTQAESSAALDCARMASECPRCQQMVRLTPAYEPDTFSSAAHD